MKMSLNCNIKKGNTMKLNKVTTLAFLSLFVFSACEDNDNDEEEQEQGASKILQPLTYSFNSRFTESESSVSYSGQVVRNLLINDIKTQMGTDAGSKNPATLLSMMANDDATRAILAVGDMSTVQTKYHDISTSHLNDRLDAVESITIPGYNATAKTLVGGWLQEAASTGKTRATGIRLDQITQKTLWGAISYWQATSKYMTKIPTDDNAVAVEGKAYTVMEHHWDESFGYFGAALDYNTGYTDDTDRKTSPYFDSNSDGKIDFKSEYNAGWAVTAAKRDLCTGCGDYDYTKTIFDAYLNGRTLIVNQEPLDQILAQRDIIMETWEKVVAAVTMHYINDSAADVKALIDAGGGQTAGSAQTADYENHWGEMRGYAHGLLYNSLSKVPASSITRILTLMGTAPVYGTVAELQAYHDVLKGAEMNAIMKQSFGFTDADVANY